MTSKSVKITSKGQVTIPKDIREKLGADTVYFEVVDDTVMLRPVLDAAGSLREFAERGRGRVSFRQARAHAWEAAVGERYTNDS